MPKKTDITVAELFAGVGGFRIALEGYDNPDYPSMKRLPAGPFKFVWANQWEPPGTAKKQFAWQCYETHFGTESCINKDINVVVGELENNALNIPDFEMLVAGFPCQDYSVAKPLGMTLGIKGEKGRLWWLLYRILRIKRPKYLLLENVDRLLRGKSSNYGRDFAAILACLNQLGYSVEWRVINAADYGFPQKRRRVYIFGVNTKKHWNLSNRILKTGVLVDAFPVEKKERDLASFEIPDNPGNVANTFGVNLKCSPFRNAGAMQKGRVLTMDVSPQYNGPYSTISDIRLSDCDIPDSFFIPEDKIPIWKKYKSAKKIQRKRAGFEYTYSEGSMPWPDPVDRPSRTILTSEGGSGASRMKHVIMGDSDRLRRLVPDELDMLQGFPKGWTNTNLTDTQRAFCMGNSLVVQIPHKIGQSLAKKQSR